MKSAGHRREWFATAPVQAQDDSAVADELGYFAGDLAAGDPYGRLQR
jgi:hypothetical protein